MTRLYSPLQSNFCRMARHSTTQADIHDALRRAEPAVAAGADPFRAAKLPLQQALVLAVSACQADCPAVLTALLVKYKVDANSVSSSTGISLLIEAAEAGSGGCIAVLLSHGADVNLPVNSHGSPVSPLYAAALNGHVAICRQLVDAESSMDFRNGPHKGTALDAAAAHGHVGVVACLMQRGADTFATCSLLQTPIMFACVNQHVLCVKALLPRANIRHLDRRGYSLLHLAVKHGGPAVLEAVLPRYVEAGLVDIPTGVDADNQIPPGATPLITACIDANYSATKLLLQAGASRYAMTATGHNALHFCIYGSSVACLQLVMGTAPDWHYTPQQLNELNSLSKSALHIAVQAGSLEMCKLLIAAGADQNVTNGDGETCADLVRRWWPEKAELAALFDPSEREPFAPPCCAACQKTNCKLSACSKCHAVRYCSTACQRAHWRAHKPACVTPKDVKAANLAKFHI